MKKIIALLLTVVLLSTCLVACGTKGATLADVKEAGKMTIATSPDFPPDAIIVINKIIKYGNIRKKRGVYIVFHILYSK